MELKLNSRGGEVLRLQVYLNNNGFIITNSGAGSPGNETELFGRLTQDAVIRFQKANNLKPDGIVNKSMLNMMGLIETTSNTETLYYTKKHLKKGEYFDGPTKKEWIFLHHTAGWHNPNNVVSGWETDSIGRIATEFVIGGQSIKNNDNTQDGVIVQTFPKEGYAWHLGTGNNQMHTNSVGIEVCNFGYLEKGGFHKYDNNLKRMVWTPLNPNEFYTYVGSSVHTNQIVELKQPFRGYKFWHKYSDKQIEATKDTILYIANRDSIDVKKGLPDLIRKEGVKAFDTMNINMCVNNKSLWNHTNVRNDKFDMFPQEELITMLLSL